jgi:hypothetical protein
MCGFGSGIGESVACNGVERQGSLKAIENEIDAAEWRFILIYNRLVEFQLETLEKHKIIIKKLHDLDEMLNESIIRQRVFNNMLIRRQYERFYSHDEWLTSVVDPPYYKFNPDRLNPLKNPRGL